jgi:hypothetical protein
MDTRIPAQISFEHILLYVFLKQGGNYHAVRLTAWLVAVIRFMHWFCATSLAPEALTL